MIAVRSLLLLPLIVPAAYLPTPASAPAPLHARVQTAILPLAFQPNVGQFPRNVRFGARVPGGSVLLEGRGVLRMMPSSAVHGSHASPQLASSLTPLTDASPLVTVGQRLPGVANEFLGSNPARWHTDIPLFASVTYHNLYRGVDLTYGSRDGALTLRWTARSPSALQSVRVLANGVLPSGLFHARNDTAGSALRTYGLEAAFRKTPNRKPTTPALTYSTPLGGSESDEALGVAVDASGNAYIAGTTNSTNFPTDHPLQATARAGGDIFVAKLDPSGNSYVYSTYLGGSLSDEGLGIAVDTSGEATVTGSSYSQDYPVKSAVQPHNLSHCGDIGNSLACTDAVVSKLSASGDRLIYSTYLGGEGSDVGSGVAVDRAGDAYITGTTDSSTFPTLSPLQAHRNGSTCLNDEGLQAACEDAFLTKLKPTGALVYSTYLGGKDNDEGNGVAVDAAGRAYLTGSTQSAHFPMAPAVGNNGGRNAFVAGVSASGKRLLYARELGGQGDDIALNVAVRGRNAYIAGLTTSHAFGQTGRYASHPRGLNAFVVRLGSGGHVEMSRLLGGSGDDEAFGIAVDSRGNIFLGGDTDSSNFPIVAAVQAHRGGGSDAFLTEMNGAGKLLQSTYLGGRGDDYGQGVAIDRAGNVYLVGHTLSVHFPGLHALQRGGTDDAFISKIDSRPPHSSKP